MSHYPHELSFKINKSIQSLLQSYTNNEITSNETTKNKSDTNESDDTTLQYNPIDILRIIKNESMLLYEKQTIVDTFDLDPHRIGWKFDKENDSSLHDKIQSILNELTVKSSRRMEYNDIVTIEASIEIKKCDWTEDVEDLLQLKFLYQRYKVVNASTSSKDDSKNDSKKRKLSNSIQNDNDSNQDETTMIRYSIDISKDHQKYNPILVLQISSKYSYPHLNDEDDGEDYKCDINEQTILNAMKWVNFNTDNFQVYTFVLVLMTFPFYEHEWNLMDCLIDDDVSDDLITVESGDGNESSVDGST